ncbi:uncharacterized protein EAF01_002029 [Botrytis porri]|uniref:MACPF domain-containing protein n=1 Tax=Botrytis porri TaxID=87229 RepID=A0A4Z1KS15_9HELO|nr:uncharacterized protein EAF01_002029 [Botrytis porri]KAF7913008.1 hypothetical protein EAF01_002029 [Botrytis porri]TGO85169.1 hypothetical protein BPOR_0424g00060 [Botrytis porri]
MDSKIDSQHGELLPICTTVGYTVNLLPQGVDPFDLSTTLESDHKYNFLKYAEPGEDITVPGSTRKYWLPQNFEKHDTGSTTETHSLICRTGTELASDFKFDAKVAANYAGFSAEAGAGYEYSTNFKTTSLYGIYSLDQKNYSINVINKQTMYGSVQDEFIDAAAKLPTWKTISKDLKDFDEVTRIYNSYAKFYSRYGSHLIQEAYMGTRYQLKVEQNEVTEEKKEEFSTNIKAEYQGAIGGSVSVDVKKSESYKQYTLQRQSDCNVLGGDPGKAGTLSHLSPDDADAYNAAFKEWQESRKEGSTDALLHIRVIEIGSFLKDSYVKSQLAVADRLSSAWSYFKDFYTFQGKLTFAESFQSEVIKLEITPLPGLEIRATGTDMFTVTQTKANSVEITLNKTIMFQHLDVTIIAPDRPVQLLFTQDSKFPLRFLVRLEVNQYEPARFRTIYTPSDARQNVRSFRDAHAPE